MIIDWNSPKIVSLRYKATQLFESQLFWVRVCAVGIWVLVLQCFLQSKGDAQKVYVVDGKIDATGTVDVDYIYNKVDVNLKSVNGHTNAFYGPSADGSYDAIHVYTGK